MTNIIKCQQGEVCVAIEIDWDERDVVHVEVIDALPSPEGVADGSWGKCIFFLANINGGDSTEHYPLP